MDTTKFDKLLDTLNQAQIQAERDAEKAEREKKLALSDYLQGKADGLRFAISQIELVVWE